MRENTPADARQELRKSEISVGERVVHRPPPDIKEENLSSRLHRWLKLVNR